ncbi:MAG TPA: hypothetical protein VMJ70_05355 [Candidatus Sulfotelmatobacter sp.]|nr:hypothetical protein [Candidatus Sulfotelmatobacter sp.]
MSRPALVRFALTALALCSLHVGARASGFDLIFADSIEVVASPGVSGFSYGNDIALIVNRGATDIGQADLSGATFTVLSSDPSVVGHATIANSASPVTPIHPLEAVGTMLPGSPLLAKVLPGETARNVFPIGVFWLLADFPVGYVGTVVLNLTMTLHGEIVEYFTLIHFSLGPEYQIAVVHAGRASSHPLPTAARPSSWGALKRLYH